MLGVPFLCGISKALCIIHSVPYMFSMSFANLSLKAQCQLTAKSEFYFYSSRSGDGKVCFNSLSYYAPSLLFYTF
jgi:hypothetical protein